MNIEDLLKTVFNLMNEGKAEEAQTQVEENRSEFGDIFGQLTDLFAQKNETADHDIFGNLTDLFSEKADVTQSNVSTDSSVDIFGSLKDLLGGGAASAQNSDLPEMPEIPSSLQNSGEEASGSGDFLSEILKKMLTK
ncbi:hypothetical protein [Vagococcus xieshaowenii]|uniref:Uncharacterized protein n=1 Tax=Vagococcus xieshaowenii TaxID=2562451 RepID=A0AAJ5JLL5_9ENTE|nr:hypothetical protein [Vagococcus xieshaowenii]QCA28656.1 hypothetical protein E4Z98_04730 [Vagococcus xieshaowenii]TFZ40537.1 hypothetical protein E4031_07045 [Vagococcus xieshaowenii]